MPIEVIDATIMRREQVFKSILVAKASKTQQFQLEILITLFESRGADGRRASPHENERLGVRDRKETGRVSRRLAERRDDPGPAFPQTRTR